MDLSAPFLSTEYLTFFRDQQKALKKYPALVCERCLRANKADLRGTLPSRTGTCQVCGKANVTVIDPADADFPNFPGFRQGH